MCPGGLARDIRSPWSLLPVICHTERAANPMMVALQLLNPKFLGMKRINGLTFVV